MDKSIGVGLIVGGVIASSLYVYQSDKFTKAQKAFLLICIIFPPLQWVSILIVLAYNNYKEQNSPEVLREKQAIKQTNSFDDKINSLKELKDKEILTEQEYNEKVKNLENYKKDSELKLSEDYIKLKSLFEDGILTKEEFENKVEILKSKLEVKENTSPEEKEEFFDGLCVFANENLDYGFKDTQGEIIIKPIYEYADNFSNGLALVRDNGKFGFINTNGEIVIDIVYENAMSFSNDKALVLLKKREFYIDKNGNEI